MKALKQALQEQPIVYVTRDIERALGLPQDTPGYYIIANSTPFAKKEAAEHDNVILIENDDLLDTWQLLEHAETSKFLGDLRFTIYDLRFVVFKNSKKIESICKKNNWVLLNPSAELANKIEGKVTQTTFLPELSHLYPPHKVAPLSTISYQLPAILQYNTSHTGSGTILLETEDQLNELKQKFPKRDVRVTKFIDGPILTNNNVVYMNGVLIGNLSQQLTGLAEFTDNPFATVGNDFATPQKLLNDKQMFEYKKIVSQVGEVLKEKGWKGLFGIDVILENKTGNLFLLEINARQAQSVVFETTTQQHVNTTTHEHKLTTFEAHLLALLDHDLTKKTLIEITNGRQIIDRKNKSEIKNQKAEMLLAINHFLHLPFSNAQPNTPYFNNRTSSLRGGLRALIGKGSPEEIVEEAKIIAAKKHIDLDKLDKESLKKFLIEHNLGIDCSGFVYHVIGKEKMKSIKFSYAKNIFQKLRCKLRPLENTNVKTLAHESNSTKVDLENTQPGDLIILLEAGEKYDRDHVLLIHEVNRNQKSKIKNLKYSHSLMWRSDPKHHHGVCQGSIEILDPNKPLTEQIWTEMSKTGPENDTLQHAKQAKILEIRHLKLFPNNLSI